MDSVIFNILFLAVILMAIIFLIIGNKQNSGMTKKQKRKMFFWEGNWYFLLVEVLVLTVGTGILWLVRLYMEKQAAYFRFQYPAGWLAGISLGMLGILAGSCCSFRRGEKVLCTQ